MHVIREGPNFGLSVMDKEFLFKYGPILSGIMKIIRSLEAWKFG